MSTCDRCFEETISTIMSMFNTDVICPKCKAAERLLPEYEQAVKADEEAAQSGNYNFPGIGLPPATGGRP